MNKYLKFSLMKYIICVSFVFHSCKCDNNLNSTFLLCNLLFETCIFFKSFMAWLIVAGMFTVIY